jgi:DNA-binding GntR family transcriptional regulator
VWTIAVVGQEPTVGREVVPEAPGFLVRERCWMARGTADRPDNPGFRATPPFKDPAGDGPVTQGSGQRKASESGSGSSVVFRRPLADQIAEQLLEGILSGRYPLDSRIVELQISRQLGTSQAPVREALRGLEALGLVEISPFRGARVRRPTTEEVLEAYVVRSELECLGIRLALPRLTDDDVEELAGCVAEMHRAAAAGDAHQVAVADAGFHWRLIELGGNGALARVWRTLEPYSRTLLTLVMPGADPMWTATLHDPILAALRDRDFQGATAALRVHFQGAEQLAARLWSETQPPTAGPPSRTRSALRKGSRAAGE